MGPHHRYTDIGDAGVLRSEPRASDAPVTPGDRIEFGPDHVIDALPPENRNSEKASTSRRPALIDQQQRSI